MSHIATIYCSDKRYGYDEIYKNALEEVERESGGIKVKETYQLRALGASLSVLADENIAFWKDQLTILKAAGIERIILLEHLDCFYAKELLEKLNIPYTLEAEAQLHRQAIAKMKTLVEESTPEIAFHSFFQQGEKLEKI